jgi:peptide deformylase
MALRKVYRFPDPVLRQPTRRIEAITDDVRQLVADMTETMYSKNGAGLAAIQVGEPVQLFIVEASVAGGDPNDLPVVFINPVLELDESEAETKDEGCLSFPGIFVPVKRALRARIRAQDLTGAERVVDAEGFYARALQHEQDHLDNRLLIDLVGPVKRQMIKRKMDKMTDEEAEELQSHGD